MPKITREGGPSDGSLETDVQAAEEDGHVISEADQARIDAMADDQETTGAPEAVDAEGEDEPAVERPGSKGVRQDWLDWAAASGYHGPCADVLTVPQIQALPDGPPAYDDDGLLVAPDDASQETRDAVERYNAQAIELYGGDGPAEETDGTLADGGVIDEADAPNVGE
jgi:hypothetical protein